jgi:hypothetical protein
MARDDNAFEDFIEYDWYRKPTVRTYQSRFATRAEPISTVKLPNGKYGHPTGYNAEGYIARYGRHKSRYQGKWRSEGIVPAPILSNASYRYRGLFDCANVINAAIANAGENEANFGEFAGEMGSSMGMITKNVTSILNCLHDLKHGNVIRAAQAIGIGTSGLKNLGRDASNKFLEWKYGWLPLMEDVNKAVELNANGLSDRETQGLLVGSASESYSTVGPIPFYTQMYGLSGGKLSERQDVRARILYKFTHPGAIRDLNRLGLLNIPSIAWNLTGLSFVVDWALPIGDYLDAFTAPTGLTYLDGYCSLYGESECIGFKPYPGLPGISAKCTDVPEACHWQFLRYVISDTPQIPAFRAPDAVKHAGSAVALLLQRTRFK